MGNQTVAIVGAGPAGAYLAYVLAQKGVDVLLFDPKAPWNKPCGSGITGKVLKEFPLLREFAGFHPVSHFHFISPTGQECHLDCEAGFYSYLRNELNSFLIDRGQQAGVTFHPKKVTQIRWRGGQELWELQTEDDEQYLAYHVVGADGANSFVARELDLPKALESPLTLGVGYYFPYEFEQRAVIKFLDDLPGFIWVLPYDGQSNVGIVATSGLLHGQRLFDRLDQFVTRFYEVEIPDQTKRFVGSIPWYQKFQGERVMGLRWTMLGDAAGWVDPVSKEGVYYSFKSAATLGEALGDALPDGDYRPIWKENLDPMLRELGRAKRWFPRFYKQPKIDAMIRKTRKKLPYQKLVQDFLTGDQTYYGLRRRLIGCWFKSLWTSEKS
jgi:geranylgeranyl reductase family protein